jgi:hypothetical protein
LNNEYTISGIILGAIAVGLLLIPAFSADTWIIQSGSSGGGETTECNNVGIGTFIVKNSTNGNCNIRSISSSNSAITITNNSNTITLSPKLKLLCENSLSSNANSITCGSFSATKDIIIQIRGLTVTSTLTSAIQFNGDTGNNYRWRTALNGGTETTSGGSNVSQCRIQSSILAVGATVFENIYMTHRGNPALGVGQISSINGATGIPDRTEFACRWSDNDFTSVTLIRESGTGQYNTGTIITVWGYD